MPSDTHKHREDHLCPTACMGVVVEHGVETKCCRCTGHECQFDTGPSDTHTDEELREQRELHKQVRAILENNHTGMVLDLVRQRERAAKREVLEELRIDDQKFVFGNSKAFFNKRIDRQLAKLGEE